MRRDLQRRIEQLEAELPPKKVPVEGAVSPRDFIDSEIGRAINSNRRIDIDEILTDLGPEFKLDGLGEMTCKIYRAVVQNTQGDPVIFYTKCQEMVSELLSNVKINVNRN